ncbi:MAG TPA: hypothetical protein HPP97_11335 [Desulfuromonadales bacterium]|nr:hypothetical protein [Desulfuromonadales bacterium]
MPNTIFHQSLYSDHLQSISFLYGQQRALLSNPEVSWKTIQKFEERLEAHLDALTNDEQALEACCQQAKEGDAGELFAAVLAFCRLGRRDLLIEIMEHLDPADTEKLQALVNALKFELPADWQDDFVNLLQTDDEQLCALIASVVGYRRINPGTALIQALRRFQSAPLIRAVGRLRERGAASILMPALRHEDEATCSAAALALLRLGERQAVDQCREIAQGKAWAIIPLALGGGKSALPLLLAIARSDEASPDALLALGILGDSSAVPILLEKLDGEHAETTAQALNLLTGAELYEQVFIPDEVNEDELFPDELEAYQKEGKLPTKPDGTPYGEWVHRLSQNPREWSEWWGQNSNLLKPGTRYRNGLPFSPATLLDTLQYEKTPHRIRQLAYEELVIRYDINFPFEADLFVIDQLRVLQDMTQWVTANGSRFQCGDWYFAGQQIT